MHAHNKSIKPEYLFRVFSDKASPKLFKHPFLELLTKTRLWIIIVLYGCVALSLLIIQSVQFQFLNLDIVFLFGSGFITWTLAEYALHRFVYHKWKDASYDTGFQYMFHGIHHQYPNDDDRIILPPVPGLIIASLFLAFFYLFLGFGTFAFSAGFLIGYLFYICVHWMVHNKSASKRIPFWWNHHIVHHFQQHDRAFGVTTPVWDLIFRTMPTRGRKTITIIRD